jgi:hypothetical protein
MQAFTVPLKVSKIDGFLKTVSLFTVQFPSVASNICKEFRYCHCVMPVTLHLKPTWQDHRGFVAISSQKLCDTAQKHYRLSFLIFKVGPIIDTDYRYFGNTPLSSDLVIIFNFERHPLNFF